jgi:hypothetical protein
VKQPILMEAKHTREAAHPRSLPVPRRQDGVQAHEIKHRPGAHLELRVTLCQAGSSCLPRRLRSLELFCRALKHLQKEMDTRGVRPGMVRARKRAQHCDPGQLLLLLLLLADSSQPDLL